MVGDNSSANGLENKEKGQKNDRDDGFDELFAELEFERVPTGNGTGNGHGGNGHGGNGNGIGGGNGTPRDDDNWPASYVEPPWPEMQAEAFHGLAGRIVEALAPLTEADPVAILCQLIGMFGSAIGRDVYCRIGGKRHHCNLFEVLAGNTAKARKGTSHDLVLAMIEAADPKWTEQSGLSSGEGVIHAVHDDIWTREKVSGGRGQPPVYEAVLKDPSVEDKRLFVIEEEFAGVLAAMRRAGNTLSPVLRRAWDGRRLQTLTKGNPETATGAHIAVVGHITIDELRSDLDRVSMSNGFANRFLFFVVRRAQLLPFPDVLDPEVAQGFGEKLKAILQNKIIRREVTFGPEAKAMWKAEYHLASADHPGLFGFLVARGETQVWRLAMIYALLDATYTIQPAHLRAALAVWRYCEASVRYIFGDAIGDPVADDLLRALRQTGPEGMTARALHELFQHHSQRLGQALALLFQHALIRRKIRNGTGGRPAEIWVAV
jgi:hypothetical protein